MIRRPTRTRTRTRTALTLTLIASAALSLTTTGARYDYTADDTLTALDQASPRARCIVYFETGGTYDPNVVGRAGEEGPAQLHPYGLLSDFYDQGYDDPYNPYQAVPYLDEALARGMANNWSPVFWGLC